MSTYRIWAIKTLINYFLFIKNYQYINLTKNNIFFIISKIIYILLMKTLYILFI
jgi:hypothetical protein